ncbi:metallophosphoesterase [Haloferula sp. A504]|uniref:metallophosphoesterase n=1 Tax=Haloferula sp. A504 TaxID=3373601 RepID=UPI0031BEB94F|nr:metallophosphoesterase [Verrucomicrobiaceae bacterium E54]
MTSHPTRRQFLRTGALVPATCILGRSALGAEPASSMQAGPPPLPGDGSFTIAVLPDTQKYCHANPENFHAQTRWLVENQEARKIAAVLHLGDITDHNNPPQWEVAQAAMNRLDGHLPYFFVPGNHDYSERGRATDRTTLLNDYFPVAKFRKLPTFGGTYDKEPDSMVNSYHRFEAGGRKFVVIGLEFGPRADVVRWANEVAAAHPDREAILITHAYTYFDETRYDWKKFGSKQSWNPHTYGVGKGPDGDVMDGEELWQNLVSKHENFIMTLNGHVLNDGLGRVTSATPGGREVHQLLVNFQMKPNSGNGWLRLMEFTPERKVEIYDYSPVLDQTNLGPQNRLTLDLAKVGAG